MIAGLAAFPQLIARENHCLQVAHGLNVHVVGGWDVYALREGF